MDATGYPRASSSRENMQEEIQPCRWGGSLREQMAAGGLKARQAPGASFACMLFWEAWRVLTSWLLRNLQSRAIIIKEETEYSEPPLGSVFGRWKQEHQKFKVIVAIYRAAWPNRDTDSKTKISNDPLSHLTWFGFFFYWEILFACICRVNVVLWY